MFRNYPLDEGKFEIDGFPPLADDFGKWNTRTLVFGVRRCFFLAALFQVTNGLVNLQLNIYRVLKK
jgi:hypothetical protein